MILYAVPPPSAGERHIVSITPFDSQSDCTGDLAGTKAPSTDVNMARSTIDDCLHALHIGLPGPVGPSVGVRDLDPEGHTLAAKIALGHLLHLLAVGNLFLRIAHRTPL